MLIPKKLALEDHAAVACVTLNFMQLLEEDGVVSKWMTGGLGLDPANVLKAEVLLGQAPLVGKAARSHSSFQSSRWRTKPPSYACR